MQVQRKITDVHESPSPRGLGASSFLAKAASRVLAGLLLAWMIGPPFPGAAANEPPDFARDIYPILQRACFECHGATKQAAGLRLDEPRFALRDRTIINPGQAAASELVRRIRLDASDEQVMPNRGAPLGKAEIARIQAWIDAGAVWPENLQPATHWAYRPPQRSVPPLSRLARSTRTPLDAWIAVRLEQSGLTFAEPAARASLLRRVSLDLIGLPPSLDDVESFEQDESPDAFERVVDRLLASPQYGVRWARPWLDYARYADSHGFQRDDFRDLWPYRDWVVNALNNDLPFTQFTLEQLAGDLLPGATESQRIATGFNRSAPTNVEAGSDPEETRVNQVHDRVHTLGMVWLGSTLECAQCHDHKYDPFSQNDYYGLFAFFNNTALEADRVNPKVPGSIQFKGPSMELMDAATETRRSELQTRLAQVQASLASLAKQAERGLEEWAASQRRDAAQAVAEHVLPIDHFHSNAGATHAILADHSVLVSGEPAPDKDTYVVKLRTTLTGIRGLKLEALVDDSLPGKGPGRGDAERPNFVLTQVRATAAPLSDPERGQPIKFTAARASFSQANLPVTHLLKADNPPRSGWAINPKFHESHWAVLETAAPLGFAGGTLFTLRLDQNYGGARTIGRLRVSVVTGDLGGESLPVELRDLLAIPAERWNPKQRQTLAKLRMRDNPQLAQLEQERASLENRMRGLTAPSTLIMREDTPRRTTVFQRGDFRTPGATIEPATPAMLHPLAVPAAAATGANASNASATGANATGANATGANATGTSATGTSATGASASSARAAGTSASGALASGAAAPTRLDLARWLVSRDNPLVARAAVNRWWLELFGRGLVGTPEDFGVKGQRPTHPELLDGLASEFMERGWSPKDCLRTLVTSATYRQESRASARLLELDDRNETYARGPRYRLEAELVRDNALAVAGLLNPRLGGPPVRPYQPDGLWVKVGGQRYDYEVSPGDEKHRRGLYVVWKRAAPYPSFVSFDANNRMACRVYRPRSNTPLQALALMNDPVYVEAAMAFAARVLSDRPQADDATRIRYAFRLGLSRQPNAEEVAILANLLAAERAARDADVRSTREFVGKYPLPAGMTPVEFTAWYAVAAAILNLDEFISKG